MANNTNDFSRRKFLATTVSGLSAMALFGLSNQTLSSPDQERKNQVSEKKIIYRTLGKTGISMPIVNMGVMNALDPALVKRSYEIGVRHFDTAAWYMRGKNEEMVGNVIKELKARDKVIIGTKIYIPHEQRNISAAEAKERYLKIAHESLKRLQTDYVDILYSHSINNIEWLNNPGIVEALQKLKKEGKARFIGFSTHSNMTACINEAIRTCVCDVILTVFNYALGEYPDYINALKNAAAKGIGLIAMKTQCSQYWYRQELPETMQKFYQGKILHTAVLKWVLRHDFITTAVPGYTNFQQMEEDFSVAYNLEYTEQEKKFLQDRNVKMSLGYCHQCQRCVPTCPKGVDIPTLMRTHMYATCYGNFYQAQDAIESIPDKKGLNQCTTCGSCQAKCSNQINISKRIDELKLIYA